MLVLAHYVTALCYWFAGSFALFALATALWPMSRTQPILRKDMLTDMCYWFIGPLAYGTLAKMLSLGLLLMWFKQDEARVSGVLEYGAEPLASLPAWVQFLLILLVSDIIQYFLHRMFHRAPWWKYHAIHHSATQVDWLTNVRFHPLNHVISFTLVGVLTVLMGFSPQVFAAMVPFNILYSAFVHANLNCSLGPLKYVIATPVFHRWHHTLPHEGGNKNFAPTFPFIDMAFGTFYMPKGKLPEVFGVTDPMPQDFLGQMAYPFKRARQSG